MKLSKLIAGLIILGLAGIFAWAAITDVPVQQTTVKQTIDNTRFYGDDNASR